MIIPVGVSGWEVGCCSGDVELGSTWTAALRFIGGLDPVADGIAERLTVCDPDDGEVVVTATMTRVVRHGHSSKRRGAVGAIGFAWTGEALGPATGRGKFVHAGHEDQSHANTIDATGVVRRIRWWDPAGGEATDLARVARSEGHYLFDLELPDG